MHWYVMRDLKRPNAKLPAYKQLSDEHLEVFTPMQWRLKLKNGKRIREEVPFMQDLLFVHDTQEVLISLSIKYQPSNTVTRRVVVIANL